MICILHASDNIESCLAKDHIGSASKFEVCGLIKQAAGVRMQDRARKKGSEYPFAARFFLATVEADMLLRQHDLDGKSPSIACYPCNC